MHKLAIWLREKRENEKMTLIDFGRHVGLSYMTVHHIEHGKMVGGKALRQLAGKYHVTTNYLRGLMNDVINEQQESTAVDN